ncbi:MAG: nitroreductase family protein [Acidimicrobiia bacterium]
MELAEAITTNGTCRFYTDEPVSDEVLARAMDYARFAPQGGNRQPVRFVAVRDRAKKEQLAEWYRVPWKAYMEGARAGQIDIGGAFKLVENADHMADHFEDVPVIVVVCADPDGVHPTDTELGRLSVVGGGSIYPAAQNFLLGCREQGLGTALTTLLCMYEPQVKELLGIPQEIITAAHICVGWPAKPFPKKLSRRPLNEIAFVDSWGASLPGA